MLSFGSIVFDLSVWNVALGVFLLALALLLYRRTYPPLSRVRRAVLACLRVLGFGLLLLFILNPVSVSLTSEVRSPLVIVLIDVSKSMSVRDEGGRSRWDEAAAALRRFHASMRMSGDAEVEIVPFASDLAPAPVPEDSIPKAEGEGTDILRAIESAQIRFRSRNLSGIVLLSDGRVTRGMTGAPMNIAVPVFTAGFGDTLEGMDIAIERVRYDRVAYVGTASDVDVAIVATGFAGTDVRVQLEDNGTVLDGEEVRIRDASAVLTVNLTFLPRTEGDLYLTVRAETPPGDVREENDRESIRIRVLEEKLHVAYIDQYADWNTTFIMDLAKRSTRFEVEAITWFPDRGFVSLPDRRPWAVPASAVGFERYDLIVVSDDARNFAVAERVEALDAYLEDGGGLLLLADEHTPLRSVSAARLLEAVLPVTLHGPVEVKTGEFSVAPSPESPTHPLATSFVEGNGGKILPPLPGRLANLAVTAGAEVPLVLRDGSEELPFCAIQRRGRGVTAVVFGFPLWRWRLAGEGGHSQYNAIVGGLIQYLAEDIDAPSLDVMTDRTVYRMGDRIGLTAYARESRLIDGVRGEAIITVDGEETVVRTFLFEPESRREGYHRAVLEPLPPGEYRISVSEIRGGETGLSADTRLTVQPVSVEFLKVSRDNEFLQYVADISGGGTIESADIAMLPEHMHLSPDRIERKEVRSLRRSLWFFISIVVVFAAEWLLRKVWGLV